MSDQGWKDIEFKCGDTKESIRVNKILDKTDRTRMKEKIADFAGGTSSDKIRITTSKGSRLDLSDLYYTTKDDEPINVELIKASAANANYLTDRGVLINDKIPGINDTTRGTGTQTVYGFIVPEKVEKWENIPKTEANNEHKRHTEFQFTEPRVKNEADTRKYLLTILEHAFNDRIIKGQDFEFCNSDPDYLIEGNFAANSVSDIGLVKKCGIDKYRLIIPIEAKKPSVLREYDSRDLEDLVHHWIIYKDCNTRVKCCIIKLYTYCVRNKNKYGILSCVNKSWFFKVEKSTLYISKLVKLKDLLQQVYNIMNLAYDDPDPDTPIPPDRPVNVPLNQIQNRQPSQQASSSSNRGRGKRKASEQNGEQNGPDENSTNQPGNSNQFLTVEIDRKNFVSYCRGGCIFRGFLRGHQLAIKYCTDKNFFDEVVNEANILRYLDENKCEHVPKYYHSYLSEERVFYLICEFITGEHLRFNELDNQRRIQYLNALSAIHDLGILHGDLSEENFLATETDVFIIDFGLSRRAATSELEQEYNRLKRILNMNLHMQNRQILNKSASFTSVC